MLRSLLFALIPLCGCSRVPNIRIVRTVEALGTQVEIEVSAPSRSDAIAGSETLLRALEAAESRLSTWRPGTELSAVNRSEIGKASGLSPLLAAELNRAFELRAATAGAFDPAVGPLVQAWSLRTAPREPAPVELQDALSRIPAAFELEHDAITRLIPGAALEEGAWGKGAAIDAAFAALLADDGSHITATIDLGGQHGFLREAGWILIADPRGRDLPAVATIDSGGSGSFATTGNSERGSDTGHILDPRTGRPAPDFGSVTVWAREGLTADALSTALFVLGPESGLSLAESQENVEALFVIVSDPDHPEASSLSLRASSGFRGRTRSLSPHSPPGFSEVR